ncbi:radical SAM family heme chaperone HemW [Colwellia sp. 4_MG-2023]|uniref:radical SAM family heme chaperone HemW n=1 Tax=unclassified Colwellia TaxID=196834 RepID=UPI0026E34FF9|nr:MULTISPECIES: radical SAM family heme chaperone HemW [unclassified Colwellia]MDO6506661.1 radical SAM family heme chaperone HemW [Colwellia sp. 5_MG-2023]MDO6555487.1 radical SAM family heme chaperone HemW [Colwellia sp. 4_MG-2023]
MSTNLLTTPPLSLYIHIPWCVEKCPYCDFNSHALKSKIPEQDYVQALIADLDADIERFNLQKRPLHSIFIGGGTPSLFSAQSIESLLQQVFSRFINGALQSAAPEELIEVTLEANPGTVEADKFIGFAKAGVTRLSIGVQSFESEKLVKLGRIHNVDQAKQAAQLATNSGVQSFNLDLMHGLPNQSIENALDDLKTAINLKPDHLSWYQLTIEPNTAFYSKPPKLPQDETLWNIQDKGFKLLTEAGYKQYEISAFSLKPTEKDNKNSKQCQHNLNYWRFGDYLGIGCGAHGKITNVESNIIQRTVKVKHPKGYLDSTRDPLDHLTTVSHEELPFEYMMNQLRLSSPFTLSHYQQRTGLASTTILPILQQAQTKLLMECLDTPPNQETWQVTALGHRYLNDLLELFL